MSQLAQSRIQAEARTKAVAAQGVEAQAQAEGELSSALGRLMVVVEQYPDLKANENMMQLTEELTSTENRIAFARQAFNDFVTAYNNLKEVFPNNILAGMFGFREATYFEVAEAETATPRVDLR